MSLDMSLLARQLSQLGRDLESEMILLRENDEAATEAEGIYCRLEALYKDDLAQSFLNGTGSVDARNAQARLENVASRQRMEDAKLEWERKRGIVRYRQASIKALSTRIDIGRSLLSREKALVGLELSGISLCPSRTSAARGSSGARAARTASARATAARAGTGRMADKKKEKPSELRSRWNRIRRYRWVAYGALIFVIVDAFIFGVYGEVNPIGWLYALVFSIIIALSFIYIGAK